MNFLTDPIIWTKTRDPFFPYEAKFDGKSMKIRLNDFPDEVMYTLIVDGKENEEFDNWPDAWKRS